MRRLKSRRSWLHTWRIIWSIYAPLVAPFNDKLRLRFSTIRLLLAAASFSSRICENRSDWQQIDGSSRAPVLRFRSNFRPSIDTQHHRFIARLQPQFDWSTGNQRGDAFQKDLSCCFQRRHWSFDVERSRARYSNDIMNEWNKNSKNGPQENSQRSTTVKMKI